MATDNKVLVDPSFRRMGEILSDADRARLYRVADVIWGKDEPMPPQEVEKIKTEAVAIVTGGWRHGSVKDWPRLRAILEVGGGLPSPKLLDYPTCFARGIRVMSSAWAFGPQVAEMALGMAIAGARDIVSADAAFRAGQEQYLHRGNVGTFLLYDKPVGFIGFGGLARALKPLLAPFRCAIQAHDPGMTDAYLRTQGVTPVDIDTLLRTSKVIFVLAVPMPANKHFLDREKLALIQPGAVLVLISRAHLVDFDALTEMVLAGRFKAAIDVFPTEPLPLDHPIRRAPGAILSAHRAGSVPEGMHEIGRMVVDDLEAILTGRVPQAMQTAQPEFVSRLA